MVNKCNPTKGIMPAANAQFEEQHRIRHADLGVGLKDVKSVYHTKLQPLNLFKKF